MADILVIGAGLAGLCAAYTLAEEGYRVTVLEAAPAIASGASGNLAGALFPRFSAADARIQAFYTAALDYTVPWLDRLQAAHPAVQFWNPCGVVLRPKNTQEADRQRRWLETPCYAPWLRPHPGGGLFLAKGGWVRPALLCGILAAHTKVNVHFNSAVLALSRSNEDTWQVRTTTGQVWQSTSVVLASAWQTAPFYPPLDGKVKPVRGQVNYLPAPKVNVPLHSVHCHNGYVLPALEGMHLIGASYERGSTDTALCPASTLGNLRRLQDTHPALAAHYSDEAVLKAPGRASIRGETNDHFPIIGALAPGVYASIGHGSRGLLTAPYGARLLSADYTNRPSSMATMVSAKP